MNRNLLIVAAALASNPLGAAGPCAHHESAVIDSQARCVDEGGITITLPEDEGATKVACMQDRRVQRLCGQDGRLTRLRAYTEWFGKLKRFENNCLSQGGTFAFQDPNFAEPQNDSFCLQAVPEVGSSMFEEPLCNYRSACPGVAVLCERPCSESSVKKLF